MNTNLIQNVHGSATITPTNTFTFHPILPQPGQVDSFKRNGTAQQLSDGSFEFQPRCWSRSRAEIIKLLPHGRLTKTLAGDYLLTIRIPEWALRPTGIIADNAMMAMDALEQYLLKEEAA